MRKDILILGAIVIVVIIAAVIGSKYYQGTVQNVQKPVTNANSTAPAGELIRPDSATLGPENAKVTLVEFYDPECEACAAFSPIVKKILKEHDGKIRFVARYMPLHPNSMPAASFTEAAGEQGKYWEARDLLFQKQPEWGEKHGQPASAPRPNIKVLFDGYAKELGLDMNKAAEAINQNRFVAKIERDKKDGQGLGVRRTPSFFVNGRPLVRFGEADLRQLIDDEMKR